MEQLELAILDVMLPDINDFTLCQKIRENHNFPVIILTAKEEIDKITGLTTYPTFKRKNARQRRAFQIYQNGMGGWLSN